MTNSNEWLARALVLSLGIFELLIFWAYFNWQLKLKDKPKQRLILGVAFVFVVLSLVLGQLYVYTDITSIARPIDADNYVAAIIFFENIAAIALGFRILIKQRRALGK